MGSLWTQSVRALQRRTPRRLLLRQRLVVEAIRRRHAPRRRTPDIAQRGELQPSDDAGFFLDREEVRIERAFYRAQFRLSAKALDLRMRMREVETQQYRGCVDAAV